MQRVTDARHWDVPARRVGVHVQGVDADKRRGDVAVALVGFPKRRVEAVRRQQEADRPAEEADASTREAKQAREGGAATCVVAAKRLMKSSLGGSGSRSVEFMLADFLRGHGKQRNHQNW